MAMKKGITQKEIARRLGVSQALVSRALSGTSARIDASPVTVASILNAAREWHYLPNAAAQTLKGAPTRTLGVIVKDFNDPFFGNLIGTLQGLAQAHRYGLFLLGWDEAGSSDSMTEMMLRKYQPDGLIVCGSDYSPPAIAVFLEGGKPVVQIGLGRQAPGVRQVGVDEPAGLEQLADYLCSLGHGRIGYIGHSTVSQQRREKSLRSALADRGLPARKDCFTRVRSLEQDTPRAVETMLSLPPGIRPTALVAGDDVMARKVMRELHEHGVTVPDQMSLAGFDDIPSAGAMIPALTSVRQPLGEMVITAFQLVTEATGTTPGLPRKLAPELIVRESCAAPAGI